LMPTSLDLSFFLIYHSLGQCVVVQFILAPSTPHWCELQMKKATGFEKLGILYNV
jgi:hypothetical protein